MEFAVTQSAPTGLISGTGVLLILLLVSFLLRLIEVAGAVLSCGLVLTALSSDPWLYRLARRQFVLQAHVRRQSPSVIPRLAAAGKQSET